MHTRKKQQAILIPLAALWIAALGFATVYDLDISLAIADSRSLYGRIFEIAGEPPAILFASFNFFLLAAHRLRCTAFTLKDKLLAALFTILGIGTTIFTSVKTADYVIEWQNGSGAILRPGPIHLSLALLAAAIICAAFIIIALTMSKNRLNKLVPIAKSCALAAVYTFAIIWAFKLIWGRVRFRNMYGDYSLFTPWYAINGFTGGFSFPSGHTANATVVFTATHYLRFLPTKLSRAKPVIYVALFIWIAAVAFSRVCVGAHFLSDVLFGAAITMLIIHFTRPKEEL